MPTMRASEALMQIFRAEGVDHLFGLPGSTETQFMDSLEDHPEIKYILGLHECIAAGMAVGYARASGKAGVLNVHTFVGMGAAMATLLDAYRGGVPLIVTAGNSDTPAVIREGGLSGDLVTLGKTFSKLSAQVDHAANLGLIMRRAFKVATQPPTGPVFIALPQNVMNENIDFAYEANPPSPFSRKRPDQESIERAAEMIARAKKPVVMLGPGVAKQQAIPEVVELVELTGAPAFIPGMSSDTLFPSTHRQFMGASTSSPDSRRLTEGADVTVVIGTQPPAAKNVIQIDSDPWELGKNAPVAAGIEGDIKLTVAELNAALKKRLSPADRQAAKARAENIAVEKEKLKANWLAQAEKERDNIPMPASRLAQELARVLQPGTVIIDESWSYSPTMLQYLDFPEPNRYFRHRGVSIGQGMPIALGVKLAMPDSPVVALVGDGSAAWSCQSLWTAAHYKLPVKFIIIHNASYRLVKQNKMRQLGEQVRNKTLGLNIEDPVIDFPTLAKSMGVKGQRVDQPDKLTQVLKSMLASDKPELIEVPVEGRI
ncbi:MAG TPA: thiamine pyrophosphate-binding protein [Dehalococcoidales bacterium]|nr:thiamine pyrophosphate-binding protein [Dehalococcoidales bacterium]